VLAWKEALDAEGIELSVWRIHRKIGMSGGLFTNQLLRETGIKISAERVERLRQAHAAAYRMQTGLGCENRAGRVISSVVASALCWCSQAPRCL